MKQLFYIILFLLVGIVTKAQGVIADGTIAQDFTFKDINGNTHNLYSYLNQGKFVVLEVFTTWCGPCWDYHNDFSDVLEGIYNDYDNPGNKKGKVLMIEADATTTIDDINGTNYVPGQLFGTTQGDWTLKAPFPLFNPVDTPANGETKLADFKTNYAIAQYPTHLLICPDKTIWADTLNKIWATERPVYEWVLSHKCNVATFTSNYIQLKQSIIVYPNPSKEFAVVNFSVDKQTKATISVLNAVGQVVYEHTFDNLMPGIHNLKVPTNTLQDGTYMMSLNVKGTGIVQKQFAVIH